ncbi:MAG: hypothetical protein IRY87_22240 [Acetobacteraceae bacterium]|nr:hypothetical protein [Acetobacteraceae bacterium]
MSTCDRPGAGAILPSHWRGKADAGAAPLLAALLARALPGMQALDLGLPVPRLFPWLPGTLCGLADPAALPAGERTLLGRFRQRGGTRPLFGFDPAADAALQAGAPSVWGEAAERLVCLPAAALAAGFAGSGPPEPLFLVPGEAGELPDAERGRIILLLGSTAQVDRYDLLVPPDRTAALFEALRMAGGALAEAAGGRWQVGGRMISPRMASLAVLAEASAGFAPPLSIPAETLVHDLPVQSAEGRLATGPAARLRLLLGALPPREWRLRISLCTDTLGLAAPVLFLEGMRHPARIRPGSEGITWLEAVIRPAGGHALVLGLAMPPEAGPGGLALTGIELLP